MLLRVAQGVVACALLHLLVLGGRRHEASLAWEVAHNTLSWYRGAAKLLQGRLDTILFNNFAQFAH